MNFTTLRSTVTAQFDEAKNTFTFTAEPYSSSAINDLLNDVVKQTSWQLTGAAPPQVDTAQQTIGVSGQCPSLFSHTNASVSMVFFLAGDDAQLLVKLGLESDWSFAGTFKELQATVFADVGFESDTPPFYVFASVDYEDTVLENGRFVSGMNFYGKIVPGGDAFIYLKDIVGSVVNTTAVGPFSIDAQGAPSMTLTLGFQCSLEKHFPILKNHAQIQLVSSFDLEQGDMTGLWLGTSFDFGNNKNLTIGTVLYPWVVSEQIFMAYFKNIGLPGASEFAADFEALIGKNDLMPALPAPYQDSGHLELQFITLGLSTKTWKPSSVSLGIGVPTGDPGWDLDGFATVKDVSLVASIDNPFATDGSRSMQVSVAGEMDVPTAGEPIEMIASATAVVQSGDKSSFEVSAGLKPDSDLTIPIGDLLNKYAPIIDDAPNITLGELGVDFKFQKPKNHYAFYAGLDPTKLLAFKFGGEEVCKVTSGKFHLENDSNDGNPGGGVEGSFEIFEKVHTQFSYEMPGDFKISTSMDKFEIHIDEMISGLIGVKWISPDWFPSITFPQTDLYIAHQSGASDNYTFALRAQPFFGAIVLQVLKTSDTWAFAAALQLKSPKIAAFESLNVLSRMDDWFSVDELLFAFASAPMPGGFQFPPTSDFPKAKGKNITFPSWAGALQAGFYFYGKMTLNVGTSENLAMVQSMFSLDVDLVFTLSVFIGENPEQNASVQAGVEGQALVGSVQTSEAVFASLEGYIGARIENGEPQFYVEGVITTTIIDDSCDNGSTSGRTLSGAVSFELTENAAFLAASMKGSINFGPITLSDLVFVIGIDAEEIPSLGFAAQIDLTVYDTTYDSSLAFFFDSGDPAKSLFAGSVSDINMGQVLDTIVGEITEDEDKPPAWMDDLLKEIALEGTCNFSITGDDASALATALDKRDYQVISTALNGAKKLPTTVSFSQTTTLIVLGKDHLDTPNCWYITDYPSAGSIMHYELVKSGSDISVSLEAQVYYCMPPGGGSVTLGPPNHGIVFNSGVHVSGVLKFFMLELEVQVDVQPNKGLMCDVALLEPLIIIKDCIEIIGSEHRDQGPDFSMATYSSGAVKPHLYVDGRIEFLGLTISETINISEKGLLFKFSESFGTDTLGANIDIDAELNRITDFDFKFDAAVHIDIADFELFDVLLGTIDLKVDVDVDLEFGDANSELFLRVNKAEFIFDDVGFSIPGFDLEIKTDSLEDLPNLIYDEVKNLVWDFFRDAEKWLEWVGKGLIKGVEDIGKTLDNVYNAIASVWSNDKRIVVAVYSSFDASNSGTITVTPAEPTEAVTQAMIDDAHHWGEQWLEYLVKEAVIKQIQKTPPDGIANFKVNVLQDIESTCNLSKNETWLMVSLGMLPALKTQDPWTDSRFYTKTTTALHFNLAVSIKADFNQVVSRVNVSLKYNGKAVGTGYTFTSQATHSFSVPWDANSGSKYQIQYTARYMGPYPDITSPWLNETGDVLELLIPLPKSERD